MRTAVLVRNGSVEHHTVHFIALETFSAFRTGHESLAELAGLCISRCNSIAQKVCLPNKIDGVEDFVYP